MPRPVPSTTAAARPGRALVAVQRAGVAHIYRRHRDGPRLRRRYGAGGHLRLRLLLLLLLGAAPLLQLEEAPVEVEHALGDWGLRFTAPLLCILLLLLQALVGDALGEPVGTVDAQV